MAKRIGTCVAITFSGIVVIPLPEKFLLPFFFFNRIRSRDIYQKAALVF